MSEHKENTKMELHDWLHCIVTAVVIGIFVFVFIGRQIGVQGDSMNPTLRNSDRVVMSRLFYTPRSGDIVVFRSDPYGTEPFVKRVMAVAGQTIDIDFATGDVIVDGVVLYEPYISELTMRRNGFEGPVQVPEGYVFVLGDNRNNSRDSRDADIGLVDIRYILGRVMFILVPGDSPYSPREWSRIGRIRS